MEPGVAIDPMADDGACLSCGKPLSTKDLAAAEPDGKTSVTCPHCGLKFFLLVEGVSIVQQIIGKARGPVIRSLEEAHARTDTWVVVEADWGGQILLTIPAALVKCPEDTLRQLVEKLAWITWGEPEGAAFYFETHKVGYGRAGGMGGGAIRDELWVHPELRPRRLRKRVRTILSGEAGMETMANAKQGLLLRFLMRFFGEEREGPTPARGAEVGKGDNGASAKER